MYKTSHMVQTIAQYRILQWLDDNFYQNSQLQITFLSRNEIEILDQDCKLAVVTCNDDGRITFSQTYDC